MHALGTNMVLNVKFSQPYSQYPVRARAHVRSRLYLVDMGQTHGVSLFQEPANQELLN